MSTGRAAGAPIDPHTVKHRGMITVAIMLATIVQALDTTIANVACPICRAACRPGRTKSPGY